MAGSWRTSSSDLASQPIRGSSSRRGPQALLEATTWLERNYSVVITPDGPRGPAYRIQDGIIQLAKADWLRNCSVLHFHALENPPEKLGPDADSPALHPCDVNFGEPIWVPRDASDADLVALRVRLEQSMHALTRD